MSQANVQCGNCGFLLSELPEFSKLAECPRCGSLERFIIETDMLKFYEQGRLTAKDPMKTGKKKIRKEIISGDDFHKVSGKWNKKTRIIDKDNNYYLEKVINPETGEVTHFCEEPLSDHQKHGSAK